MHPSGAQAGIRAGTGLLGPGHQDVYGKQGRCARASWHAVFGYLKELKTNAVRYTTDHFVHAGLYGEGSAEADEQLQELKLDQFTHNMQVACSRLQLVSVPLTGISWY